MDDYLLCLIRGCSVSPSALRRFQAHYQPGEEFQLKTLSGFVHSHNDRSQYTLPNNLTASEVCLVGLYGRHPERGETIRVVWDIDFDKGKQAALPLEHFIAIAKKIGAELAYSKSGSNLQMVRTIVPLPAATPAQHAENLMHAHAYVDAAFEVDLSRHADSPNRTYYFLSMEDDDPNSFKVIVPQDPVPMKVSAPSLAPAGPAVVAPETPLFQIFSLAEVIAAYMAIPQEYLADYHNWHRVTALLKGYKADSAVLRELFNEKTRANPKYQPGDENKWDTAASYPNTEQLIMLADEFRTSTTTPEPAPPVKEIDFGFMTLAEFDALDLHVDPIIADVLYAGQPMLMLGAYKTMKTTTMLAQAIAVAAGVPFAGRFEVPPARPVMVMSCEAGRAKIQQSCRAVCEYYGLSPRQIRNLFITHKLLDIVSQEQLTALEKRIKLEGVELIYVDPVYKSIPSALHENVFSMGGVLNSFSEMVANAGATEVMLHHTVKHADSKRIITLADSAYAGFAEHYRSWNLLTHYKPFSPTSGWNHLRYEIGGSMVPSGLYYMDVYEGTTVPRKYRPEIRSHEEQEIIHKNSAEGKLRKRIIEVLTDNGEMAGRDFKTALNLRTFEERAVRDEMVAEGTVLCRQEGKKVFYKLP